MTDASRAPKCSEALSRPEGRAQSRKTQPARSKPAMGKSRRARDARSDTAGRTAGIRLQKTECARGNARGREPGG